jgi:hypothetical protein
MLVTPEDFRQLNERAFSRQSQGPRVAIPVLEKLVDHIQPRLVFTDAGGAVVWFENVELARGELTLAGNSSRQSSALERLANVPVRPTTSMRWGLG